MSEFINPYSDEQLTLQDELRQELAALEIRKQYLERLLEYYEDPSNLPAKL